MRTIYSTHALHPRAVDILAPHATLRFASALDADTLVRETRDVDAIIVRAPLPPAIFSGDHAIRAAIRHGAGLDMIPVEAATAAGVLVSNVPGANARTVAEAVMFSCLALARRYRLMDRDLRGKGWLAGRAHADLTSDLGDRSIGIVGFGAIGKEIAAIAHAGFRMDVRFTSRSGRGGSEAARATDLDTLVATSDFVVLCCPLTPETTGLIDARRLAAMKPGAFLINVSRGPVVDETALVEALRGGHLGGAALDVFANQPLPPDHPLFAFDNVILTPHMAGITEQSMERMGTGAAADAVRVLQGRLPVNLRNPEAIAAYLARFPDTVATETAAG
jgi:D-3-phosphoglycerate dehydrogenase